MTKSNTITTKELYQQWTKGPKVLLDENTNVVANAEYPTTTIFHTLMYTALHEPKPWHTDSVLQVCATKAICSPSGGVEVLIRNVKENIRTQIEPLQTMSMASFAKYSPPVLHQCTKMVDTLQQVLRKYYEISPNLINKNIEHDTSWMYLHLLGMKTTLHDDDLLLEVLKKESQQNDRMFDSIDEYIEKLFHRQIPGFIEHLMIKNEDFVKDPWIYVSNENQNIERIVHQHAPNETLLNQIVNSQTFNANISPILGKTFQKTCSENSARQWIYALVNAKQEVAPFPIDHPLQPLNTLIILALCKKGFDYTSDLHGFHPLQKEMHLNANACMQQIQKHLTQDPILTPAQLTQFHDLCEKLVNQKWSMQQCIGSYLQEHPAIEWLPVTNNSMTNDKDYKHE